MKKGETKKCEIKGRFPKDKRKTKEKEQDDSQKQFRRYQVQEKKSM